VCSSDLRAAQKLGEKIVTNEHWKSSKIDVMKHLIEVKATRCPQFVQCLCETGNKRLVENTGHPFWARGSGESGLNILGTLLELLREKIKKRKGRSMVVTPLPRFVNRTVQCKYDVTDSSSQRQQNPWSNHTRQATCDYCGEPGHLHRNCKHGDYVQCHTCGCLGHKQKYCPNSSQFH
jgi:hypothetical protein